MSESPDTPVAAAPAPVAAPPAAKPAPIAWAEPLPEAPGLLGEILDAGRRWQTSLTLQGGALGGAAAFVAAKGAPLLVALGASPALAAEAVGDIATVMGAIGTLMVFIGRLRIGDLK